MPHLYRSHFPVALGMILFVAAGLATAQSITGRLLGTVEDQSKAVVPNAQVTVVNQDTGIEWKYTTDVRGAYLAPSLPPGQYRVIAEANGFKHCVVAGNTVNVAQDTRVDLTMTIGSVSETIEVSARGALVQTMSSGMGEVIDQKQIQNLPLNGRIFSQMTQLVPGATPGGFSDAAESASGAGAQGAISANVNGVNANLSNYTVDGVNNKEPLNGFISLAPPVEAIQEFNVQTASPTAEFGGGGATVNLAIRSGGNELHGSAFEFVRNDKLNARNFFSTTIPPFKSNQFGGTIGGPIRRNKAFFFADYQGLQLRSGSTVNLTVPTASMRNGIFSGAEAFNAIYDPSTGAPFPNNSIPASRMDAVTKQVAQIYPMPNLPTTYRNGPGQNYRENISIPQVANQGDIKLDYQLSDRSHLFARESYSARNLTEPAIAGNKLLQNGQNVNAETRNHNAVIGHTYTISSNMLNEARLGFNRFHTFDYGNDYGTNENNSLGIPNGNLSAFPETSGIAAFGNGMAGLGSPGWTNAYRISSSFELTDALLITSAKHNIKIGMDLMRTDSSLTNPQTAPRGSFSFDQNYTSNRGAANTGVTFANFLLGLPTGIQRDVVNTFPDVRRFLPALYVQDDFRAARNLTFNLGMRWESYNTPSERWNRQANLNPVTGALIVANGSNRGPNVDSYSSFSPHVGFSYSPDQGKTAVRGAFALSYGNDVFGANGGTLERNYPFFQIYSLTQQDQFTPWAKVSADGLPNAQTSPVGATISVPANLAPYYVPQDFKPDRILSWNFGVQRQILPGAVLDVSYVGTRGVHLYRERDIDTAIPGAGTQSARRPFNALLPQISSILRRGSDGDSHYNSLQVKVTKRFSHGLQALVAYTFSKSIDDLTNFYPYNDLLNRGVSASDYRHYLVASYTYELPFGKDRHWLNNASRPVEVLAGGWAVNGITTLRTGGPLTVSVQTSLLNNGKGNRANVTCTDVRTIGLISQWFDTSCYSLPAQYAFGTGGIGTARGPGLVNFDLSIFKSEKLGERRQIEIRAEAFNATNTAHFNNPNTTMGSTNFGIITGAGAARQIQLGMKFQF